MQLARTAKKGAKGWAAFKVGKGAAKSAGKVVKRKSRRGPSTRERVAKIGGAVGITAAVAFLLSKLDRRKAAGKAKGAVAGAASTATGGKDYDDVTLARKVESEIFRDADAPKGKVSVNAENGVVFLRGELDDPAWIERLGSEAEQVGGVKGVRNLLHAPGTPAPVAPATT